MAILNTAARRLFTSPPFAPSTAPARRRAAVRFASVFTRRKISKEKEEWLKRRTRSPSAFDPDLLRRYASGHRHVPVLLADVLRGFEHVTLRSFADCTLGAGAHSAAIIEAHPEMELYVGMDIDPSAHAMARARLDPLLTARTQLKAYTDVSNFKHIKHLLAEANDCYCFSGDGTASGIDGILIDLGMSSMQVDLPERGFSVMHDGPLDMRMDPEGSLRASDILNSWPEAEVGRILRDYGEESNWRYLQRKIISARSLGGFSCTGDLVKLIQSTSRASDGRQGWIKTATRVFQALRIAVNDELQTLEDALHSCFDCLSSGGRLAVISFHSLEDRIVKKSFLSLINGDEADDTFGDEDMKSDVGDDEELWGKRQVHGKNGIILTKRPVTPTKEEEGVNPRCRSAKLRMIQKG